eukprot:1988155-Prymnesium_polylepis.2
MGGCAPRRAAPTPSRLTHTTLLAHAHATGQPLCSRTPRADPHLLTRTRHTDPLFGSSARTDPLGSPDRARPVMCPRAAAPLTGAWRRRTRARRRASRRGPAWTRGVRRTAAPPSRGPSRRRTAARTRESRPRTSRSARTPAACSDLAAPAARRRAA